MFIDYHSHSDSPVSTETFRVQSLDLREPCLFDEQDDSFHAFTVGIHPWYLNELTIEQQKPRIQQLSKDTRCIALGEMGLDRACDISWELQVEAFRSQLEWSKELDNSVCIIHCVRAYPDILQIAKEASFNGTLVFHDFNGSPEFMQQALKQGHYFSFGKALDRKKSAGHRSFLDAPLERLFLETDAEDELSIEFRYKQAAALRGVSVESFVDAILENFRGLHGNNVFRLN